MLCGIWHSQSIAQFCSIYGEKLPIAICADAQYICRYAHPTSTFRMKLFCAVRYPEEAAHFDEAPDFRFFCFKHDAPNSHVHGKCASKTHLHVLRVAQEKLSRARRVYECMTMRL